MDSGDYRWKTCGLNDDYIHSFYFTMMRFLTVFLFILIGASAFSQKEGVFICGTGLLEDSIKIVLPDSTILDGLVVYSNPDERAQFVGGHDEMKKYLSNNINYPPTDGCIYNTSKAYTEFIVLKNGSISAIKILRGVPDCPECDKEAVRVIKNMPNWIPAKVNGQPVNSYFYLPVKFEYQ